MKYVTQPSSNKPTSFFNHKVTFYTGLFIGGLLGISLATGCGILYLLVSQDTLTVKNGTVSFSKPINTISTTENIKPSIQGDKNNIAASGGISNSGDKANVIRDPVNSMNQKDSPSIVGDHNTVNIANPVTLVPNRELPGYDEKSYIGTLPSDLRKYSNPSDFQPDSLIKSASDSGKIQFKKQEIVILGKAYTSLFDVSYYSDENRFVFKLDGSQKAALLQFGLPDLQSGSTTNGLYLVKISADGQPLWAGECRRSQGNQIISVPLNLAGKETLTIEVTSNGKNESNLFFTKAKLLRD
jgi:hypothetical protein